MKKAWMLVALPVFLLAACNNDGETKTVLDSLDKRKDTLVKNVDSTANAVIDSVEQWKQRQKEKFDSAAQARKDSIKSN